MIHNSRTDVERIIVSSLVSDLYGGWEKVFGLERLERLVERVLEEREKAIEKIGFDEDCHDCHDDHDYCVSPEELDKAEKASVERLRI